MKSYYIGIEDALNCANFKDFIASNEIEKYGYDIKNVLMLLNGMV
ncbi:hypothetical protein SD457_04135 [Coprobacillaceae bacterium CR2/5/TPMF4]|nr:hypothetical protein SD457_04135 [Coprobacillaceae bacterium CR2/5/TPMF4]